MIAIRNLFLHNDILIAQARKIFNLYGQLASKARVQSFGLSLWKLNYSVSASNEGSGKTTYVRSLGWAFATRQCDAYQNLY